MTHIANIIRNLENKLERQRRAVADTEHHIQILRQQPAGTTLPTPLEEDIARAEKETGPLSKRAR